MLELLTSEVIEVLSKFQRRSINFARSPPSSRGSQIPQKLHPGEDRSSVRQDGWRYTQGRHRTRVHPVRPTASRQTAVFSLNGSGRAVCAIDCRSYQSWRHLLAARPPQLLLAPTLTSKFMDAKSKQSKRRDDVFSSLNVIIEGLNIAKNLSSITPAKAVFSTASVILTMIRVSFLLLRKDPLRAD